MFILFVELCVDISLKLSLRFYSEDDIFKVINLVTSCFFIADETMKKIVNCLLQSSRDMQEENNEKSCIVVELIVHSFVWISTLCRGSEKK